MVEERRYRERSHEIAWLTIKQDAHSNWSLIVHHN
jgi:hypothetical protein